MDDLLLAQMGTLPDTSPAGERYPLRLHVAPIGSGARVIEDDKIWRSVSQAMRKTLGLEMEAAMIGEMAHRLRHRKLDWLVMKGVMDFADRGRDDRGAAGGVASRPRGRGARGRPHRARGGGGDDLDALLDTAQERKAVLAMHRAGPEVAARDGHSAPAMSAGKPGPGSFSEGVGLSPASFPLEFPGGRDARARRETFQHTGSRA